MKKKYAAGSVTVEASLVFPIVMFVFLAVIRLGFYLHDIAVANMVNEYGHIRERVMTWSSYNPENKAIDCREIVNKPLIQLTENIYSRKRQEYLEEVLDEYKRNIYIEKDGMFIPYENVGSGLKNSTVVRAVYILIDHAERIKYD